MRARDTDEGLAPHCRETHAHLLAADARVDHDRDRADLEEGEDQREEVRAGREEDYRACPARDADVLEAVGVAISLLFELGKCHVRVARPPRGLAVGGPDHGAFVRIPRGHRRELGGDVDGSLARPRVGERRGRRVVTCEGHDPAEPVGCASRNAWTSGPICSPASSST